MSPWKATDIPPQQSRTAIVTGTGGIGFEVALALARAGASVILAGRNPLKGQAAVQAIQNQVPGAEVVFMPLDLASLHAVRRFSQRLWDAGRAVDLLVNNAAVMTPPTRQLTADGFELQIGTNFLGHFALTAQLLPLLRQGSAPRVVTLSSIAARQGTIHLEDLQSERLYKPMQAYSQSKLACLMFALALQRRSDEGGWGIQSLAAHPGIARTELLPNGAGEKSLPGRIRRRLWFLFQPAAQGALPALFAAAAKQARGGSYIGPNGLAELRGHPAPAQVPLQALDTAVAAALWSASESLTSSFFPSSSRNDLTGSSAFRRPLLAATAHGGAPIAQAPR